MTQIVFPVNASAYTSVGNCPVTLQATNAACVVVVSDTQPTIGTPGTTLLPNDRSITFVAADAGSQAWVATMSGTSFVAGLSVTGPFTMSGTSPLTLTDGTNTVVGATQITTAGAIVGGVPAAATLTVAPAPTTVAALPASPAPGQPGFVTDSTVVATGNFGAIVAGTGTHHVPVYWDDETSHWRIG